MLRTKCGWHQQMKCQGGDECYHQSFHLWGLEKHDIYDKLSDKQDKAVFQTCCILLLWEAGREQWQTELVQTADAGDVCTFPTLPISGLPASSFYH